MEFPCIRTTTRDFIHFHMKTRTIMPPTDACTGGSVFVKIQKKNWGGGGSGGREGSGWGVRLDVIEELKFLGKFTKKRQGGGGGGGSV